MLEALTEGSYYEFPSFEVALFSILLSFVLSCLIAFVYHYTSQSAALSRNFIQALIMSSIVTCMVIMAVGNNIAAGFGIMGAIAIIRFRMRIENPRNIIFIFASLSVGIAAGVYGYAIAISGTAVFSMAALVLYVSPYGSRKLSQEFGLHFLLLREVPLESVYEFFKEHCTDYRMILVASRNRGNRYEFFVTLKSGTKKDDFYQKLIDFEGIENLRMERSDNLTRL